MTPKHASHIHPSFPGKAQPTCLPTSPSRTLQALPGWALCFLNTLPKGSFYIPTGQSAGIATDANHQRTPTTDALMESGSQQAVPPAAALMSLAPPPRLPMPMLSLEFIR